MKNCFFCNRPVGTVVAQIEYTEWGMNFLETITEFAHMDCLEQARKNFDGRHADKTVAQAQKKD